MDAPVVEQSPPAWLHVADLIGSLKSREKKLSAPNLYLLRGLVGSSGEWMEERADTRLPSLGSMAG